MNVERFRETYFLPRNLVLVQLKKKNEKRRTVHDNLTRILLTFLRLKFSHRRWKENGKTFRAYKFLPKAIKY